MNKLKILSLIFIIPIHLYAQNASFVRVFLEELSQKSSHSVQTLEKMTVNFLKDHRFDPYFSQSVPNYQRAGFSNMDDVKNTKNIYQDKRIEDILKREAHLIFKLEKNVVNQAYQKAYPQNYQIDFNHFAEVSQTKKILDIRPNPQESSTMGKSTDFYLNQIDSKLKKSLLENAKFYSLKSRELNDPALFANFRRSIEAEAKSTIQLGQKVFNKSCPNLLNNEAMILKANIDELFYSKLKEKNIKSMDEASDEYQKALMEELGIGQVEARAKLCHLIQTCQVLPNEFGRFCL